jgi:hypothetical protein
MTKVTYAELVEAFDFVSFDSLSERQAFVSLDTGAIVWLSDDEEVDGTVPDEIESSDRYLAVPHKRDLDLGTDLVFRFVEQSMPDDYDRVRSFFRKRGAYARFKDFLAERNHLEEWYQFETKATQLALTEWCAEHRIELVDGPSSTGT